MINKKLNLMCGFRLDYDPDKKIVKQDRFKINDKKYFISTVDLGMDHSFINDIHLYNVQYKSIYKGVENE